ncbi:MAG TPA: orotidine-5'-phosphate decarboxylase [Homoserinimonas sp.]|nr:orotidine-5'-phosphate decarboxylase [Homoserinimonas sp.]
MTSFGSRLAASFERYGQLCVGIDPHPWLLNEWELPDTATGARDFGLRAVDAASGQVGTVKPQVAFYERFGSAGYAALEEVLAAARSVGLLVIADVKRGDVGTSVEAYGQAWLTPGSPLEADAITVSAYQGVGSLSGPLELADRHGKGLFVLSATSNSEAAALQLARTEAGDTVAQAIVREVADWNATYSPDGLGSVGVVIGATVQTSDYGMDLASMGRLPILAPGFGHQGARIDQFPDLFGAAAGAVLVSVSRSILSAGPQGIDAAIADQAAEVLACRG